MGAERFDVVVVGNTGVDTTVFLHSDEIDLGRETHYTDDIDSIGHSGSYAARGFARLGYRVALISSLGDDHHGRWLRDTFTADGIDLSGVFIDPQGTGRSVNLLRPDGRRTSFFDGRSHMTLMPDMEVCRRLLSETRHVHFSIPNWARHLLALAHECGATVSTDVQDVVHLPDPYRQDFIEQSDVLFFSATNVDDPGPLAAHCRQLRPDQLVVVGMGSRGCAVDDGGGLRRYAPPALPLPLVDTTGAGDALAVGFLAAHVLEGMPVDRALQRGQLAARHTCAQRATSHNLVTRERLDELEAEVANTPTGSDGH